jgi:hypothetical protein
MQKLISSRLVSTAIIAAACAVLTPRSFAQGPSPELQQKVAAIRESVAANKALQQHYSWTETQQTLLKGEVKSTKVSQCMYGPDGTVQKTPIGGSAPAATPGGLKGRVVQKKKDEMQDYMERVASLIQRYTPPDAAQMQASFQAGNAAIVPAAGGVVSVVFNGYAKPGDAVTVTLDSTTKQILSFKVNTYLDSPQDVVTLNVVFASLPGGPNYVSQTVLDATAKQIRIQTTSSGYTKIS